MFSSEFGEISKNIFFTEHLLATASFYIEAASRLKYYRVKQNQVNFLVYG